MKKRMKKIKINVVFTEKELMQEMGRFRFQETDLDCIRKVNRSLVPMLDIRAFYDERGKAYIVFVTLGTGIDRLQEQFSLEEKVFEEYVTECLGMVYLSRAYEKVFAAMSVQEKKALKEFCFWEDCYGIEDLVPLLNEYSQTGIICSSEGVMSPSKSVVMLVWLCHNREKACQGAGDREKLMQGMCLLCKNKCEYGIAREKEIDRL